MSFVDLFLHLDTHLEVIIGTYGVWTYALLFVIVFCETGLVVTPILPGDSLLFAAGTFAARESLDIRILLPLLISASILGNSLNYTIGHFVGPKIFSRTKGLLFRKEHLERTQTFYERHGKVTVILAQFLPIIRTFAPFVAGIGRMQPFVFAAYMVTGAVLWAGLFLCGGYFFGSVPFVRNHFEVVILGIIVVSLMPAIIGLLRRKKD